MPCPCVGRCSCFLSSDFGSNGLRVSSRTEGTGGQPKPFEWHLIHSRFYKPKFFYMRGAGTTALFNIFLSGIFEEKYEGFVRDSVDNVSRVTYLGEDGPMRAGVLLGAQIEMAIEPITGPQRTAVITLKNGTSITSPLDFDTSSSVAVNTFVNGVGYYPPASFDIPGDGTNFPTFDLKVTSSDSVLNKTIPNFVFWGIEVF